MNKRNLSVCLSGCFFGFLLLLFFSFPSTAHPSAASHYDTVQKIYIGYYQRPADPAGLVYWAGRLDTSGGDLAAIIEAFANSAESQALYGTINRDNISDVVNNIYLALCNRDAEAGGRDYYVNGFNTGQFTAATIMLNVLYGAQNEDLLTLNNKLTAANLFTKTIDPELDGINFQVTYAGEGDAIAGRNFLALYATSAQVPTLAETTEYIRTNIVDPGDPLQSLAGMVLIPLGTFQMGDNTDGMIQAMPVHDVTVSTFYLDKFEVTKSFWDNIYNWATAHGYTFDNVGVGTAASHPVLAVSWYDVVKWLNARSEKDGRRPVYYTDSDQSVVYRTGQVDIAAGAVNWSANGYRLPTEAEWEYAARAGTTTRFYTGSCISTDQANYNGASPETGCPVGRYRGGTTIVGSFPANPWGLYDMAGNVWEWTWDWYGDYSSGALTNPKGPDSGLYRVHRGGSGGSNANFLRSANRGSSAPAYLSYGIGFRSALSQP